MLQGFYNRGRYQGFLYLDSLVRYRDKRRGLIAMASAIEDLDELDYCSLHYSMPIADTLSAIGLDESLFIRHRINDSGESLKRAFVAGFVSGIASFRTDKIPARIFAKHLV